MGCNIYRALPDIPVIVNTYYVLIAMLDVSHLGSEPKPHDTGMEVRPHDTGLEVQQPHSNLEVNPMHNAQPVQGQWGHWNKEAAYKETTLPSPKKIFGLARQTFWLLIALTLVVIVSAVGGGVGGSIAVQNAK